MSQSAVNAKERLMRRLETTINSGRFFHACILSGGGGEDIISYLSQAAVCTAGFNGGKIPCGVCEGCRKAAAGIHPDIDRIERQGSEIVVTQVRDMRKLVYQRPNEAPRRVVIISDADRMNRFAQNALLNILEEPPSDVLFILAAENEDALLETVRSRCVLLRMEKSTGLSESAKQAEPGEQPQTVELAGEIAEACFTRDTKGILTKAPQMERLKKEEYTEFLSLLRERLIEQVKTPSQAETQVFPLGIADECLRLITFAEANVSPAVCTGRLIAKILEK